MFGGRFGNIPYGRRNSYVFSLEFRVSFYETVRTSSMVGVDSSFSFSPSMQVNGNFFITRGIPFGILPAEALSNQTDLTGTIPVAADMTEQLLGSAEIATDFSETLEIKESVKSYVWISVDYSTGLSFQNELHGQSAFSVNFYSKVDVSEILGGFSEISEIETEVTVISVTLRPGETLRIDAESYNVFLNKQNVIHLHSGAWPMVDNGVLSVAVDSGTGGKLSGTLYFVERYL